MPMYGLAATAGAAAVVPDDALAAGASAGAAARAAAGTARATASAVTAVRVLRRAGRAGRDMDVLRQGATAGGGSARGIGEAAKRGEPLGGGRPGTSPRG